MTAPRNKVLADRAREMKSQGRTRDEIAAELGVSTGWVSKAWARGSRTAEPRPVPVAPTVATSAEPDAPTGQRGASVTIEAPTGNETLDEFSALLRRQTEALERMRAQAEMDGDLSAFATLSRAISSTTAQIVKMAPPPRRDPEDSPDMKAAAASARKKLHDLLERAMGGEA